MVPTQLTLDTGTTPHAACWILWHFLGGDWGQICPKRFCLQRRTAGREGRPGQFFLFLHFACQTRQQLYNLISFFLLLLLLLLFVYFDAFRWDWISSWKMFTWITWVNKMWHNLTFLKIIFLNCGEIYKSFLVPHRCAEMQNIQHFSPSLNR